MALAAPWAALLGIPAVDDWATLLSDPAGPGALETALRTALDDATPDTGGAA